MHNNFLQTYHLSEDELSDDLSEGMQEHLHPKKHKREYLVEDCYVLGISDLTKGLLRPIITDTWTENYAKPFELGADTDLQGKQGEVFITDRYGKQLQLKYSVDLVEPPVVHLSFLYRNSWHNQTVFLDELLLGFGMRPFFLCACGYRAGKLYLAANQYSFLCRSCAALYYESTSINPNSQVGGFAYALFKRFKLDLLKQKVKRISYKGKYTRRARRVLGLAGTHTPIDGTRE
jgi:hypothetical protein